MKKLSLLTLLIFLMCGCSNEQISTTENNTIEEVAMVSTEPQTKEAIFTEIESVENEEYSIDVHTSNFTSLNITVRFTNDDIEKNVLIIKDYLDKYKTDTNEKYSNLSIMAYSAETPILYSSYKYNGNLWETTINEWMDDEYQSKYSTIVVKSMDEIITSSTVGEPTVSDVDGMSVKIFNYGTYDSANIWIKATLDSDQVELNTNLINTYIEELKKLDITNFKSLSVVFDYNGDYVLLVPFMRSGETLYVSNYVVCNSLYTDNFNQK